MGNKESDNSNSAKERFIDLATTEAHLIWNRYGCLVVANSILLGFIGQLIININNTGSLGIWACGFGLFISILWLFLTSYAWSFAAYMIYKSDTPQKNAYEEWKGKIWSRNIRYKDPMWVFAHLVILVFCFAYILLTYQFSECYSLTFLIAFIIVLVCWYKKVASFDESEKQPKS